METRHPIVGLGLIRASGYNKFNPPSVFQLGYFLWSKKVTITVECRLPTWCRFNVTSSAKSRLLDEQNRFLSDAARFVLIRAWTCHIVYDYLQKTFFTLSAQLKNNFSLSINMVNSPRARMRSPDYKVSRFKRQGHFELEIYIWTGTFLNRG